MSAVTPALRPEEWTPPSTIETHPTGPRCHDSEGDFWIEGGMVWRDTMSEGEQPLDNPHGVAALCLHGQTFGFTQEDVAALEDTSSGYEEGHSQDALDRIAAKIRALLPPEGP